MSTVTIQPAGKVPPDQVHGLSHHPMIQAVLAKGMDHRWTHKEVAEVIGTSDRSVQNAAEGGQVPHMAFNMQAGKNQKGVNRRARRFAALDIILWLLRSYEGPPVSPQEAVGILAALLNQLSDAVLLQVEEACSKIRRRRTGKLVIAQTPLAPLTPQATARLINDQLDLFPSPGTPAPEKV